MKKAFTFLILLVVSTTVSFGQCSSLTPAYLTTTPALYDLNNDGVSDILLDPNSCSLVGKNGAKVETDGSRNIIAYNSGVTLGVNTLQDTGIFRAPTFPINTLKFVGLKIKHNGAMCCAWLRIRYNFPTGYYLELSDYVVGSDFVNTCFSSSPNFCIKTGEAGIGVGIEKQQAEEGLQVQQTPNSIKVTSTNEPTFNVLITDFLGRKLYVKENVVNEIVIDKDLVESNTYLIVVSFPALQEAKKVFRLANN
ncbi:MAG: hypothetical protein JNL95_07965 [Chitinophagales bacterium]|nr:hypothetical protein [Chitinophagales bacterium]